MSLCREEDVNVLEEKNEEKSSMLHLPEDNHNTTSDHVLMASSLSQDRTTLVLSNRQLETVDLHRSLLSKNIICYSTCRTLCSLDLSRNRLTALPVDLCQSCPALQSLDISRNKLRGLPTEIGQLQNLKQLIALSNKFRLRELPLKELASLQQLELLDLRWNEKLLKESARQQLQLFQTSIIDKKLKLVLSPVPNKNKNLDDNDNNKLSACDRDANDLRSQLEPLSTPQMRKRLDKTFGVHFIDSNERAYDREAILQQLLTCYNDYDNNDERKGRSVRTEQGVPLEPSMVMGLLTEMESIQWPRTTRERPKVSAVGYVILQRPTAGDDHDDGDDAVAGSKRMTSKAKLEAAKLQRFRGIWTKAMQAMEQVDPKFASQFTALAVTKNFRGSPHIDTLNVAPFYGLSLGEFTDGGGKLCVECSPTEVAEIDTRGKLAKVDGRFPHWVSDYEGTRYSLIYYVTSGEVIPQTTAVFKPAVRQEGEPSWVPPRSFVL